MPAFDVDFNASPPPERDRVKFNGVTVPGEFLKGENGVWILNNFDIPIEQVMFPADPGENGTVVPVENEVRIDIDTASPAGVENWCTSIDWAALTIEVAAPALLVHGIISSSTTWTDPPTTWPNGLQGLGIPYETIDMGALDSIERNAGKIAAVVEGMKLRLGVQRVNLVTHSKGGIDARQFAEKNKGSVAQLIQIGTPNAGSPLANVVQTILLGGTVAGTLAVRNSTFIRLFLDANQAFPAGYQLTTPAMFFYNQRHNRDPKTRYISLAGDYSGAFRSRIVAPFFLFQPNDTVVPVSSVFALPYAEHLRIESSGEETDAVHFGTTPKQTSSARIFAGLKGRAAAPVQTEQSGSQSALLDANEDVNILPPEIGIVRQGEKISTPIRIDGGGISSVSMMYGAGNLDLVLITPTGRRIDPTAAAADPDIEFDSEETVEGEKAELYSFSALQPGIYTAEVSGAQVHSSSGEAYLLIATQEESTVDLRVITDRESYSLNDSIVIRGTLVNNMMAPVLGAAVSAHVGRPGAEPSAVTLHDDGIAPDQTVGDGTYSGTFANTSIAGIYGIAIRATSDTVPFSRSVYLQRPVSSSTTELGTELSEAAVDTNGNGLFEEVRVEIPVNVSEAGEYTITGKLTAQNGRTVADAVAQVTLPNGAQVVSLSFEGASVYQSGLDGPYTLSLVSLFEENDAGDILPLDEEIDSFETRDYGFRSFERAGIFLSGTGNDTGIDVNNNAKFERLDVNLDVDLAVAGNYEWSARLVSADGNEIDVFASSGALSAGMGSLPFSFDGTAIRQSGKDGPYRVKDLLIFGAGTSQVVFDAYTTSDYRACQFEGSGPACGGAPVADAGRDRSTSEGKMVTLDGSKSRDPDGTAVRYQWTQTGGPAVTLSNPAAAKPKFRSPFIGGDIELTFELVVNDGQLDSPPDQVVITVGDRGASLHGLVTSKRSGVVVPGSKISIAGTSKPSRGGRQPIRRSTKTDKLGFYAFTDLPPGFYAVTVEPPQEDKKKLWTAHKVTHVEIAEDQARSFRLRTKGKNR